MKTLWLFAGALMLAPGRGAAQVSLGWADFQRTFQAYTDSDQVVGASVVLMKNGRVIARYDHGSADRTRGTAVDSQTIFHWGSITKSLTAISIMQLRDRGRLSLDDRIIRWVPELRTMHDPFGMMDSITIRMLLSHTAGFQNGTWPYGNNVFWEPFEPTTWNQLVAMMPYQTLLFRPGSRYGYSNPAFIYLARVIEQVTGDPWDAYIQKNIFAPLELDRSYFRTTPFYLAAHRSHNYHIRKDSAGRAQVVDNGPDFDPGITSPNGAWNAPLGDLVKYTAFLTNTMLPGMSRERYDVVLSRQSLAEMWKPGMPMSQGYESAAQQWMGLSFFIRDRYGQRILGHTGSQAGFRSFFYFDPSNGMAVIAAFNTTNTVAPAIAAQSRMQEAALDLLVDRSARDSRLAASPAGCRPVDELVTITLQALRNYVTAIDSGIEASRQRTGLPAVPASRVAYVTDNAICARAERSYTGALTEAGAARRSMRVYVFRVGNAYQVWDPAQRGGEFTTAMTLDADFKVVAKYAM